MKCFNSWLLNLFILGVLVVMRRLSWCLWSCFISDCCWVILVLNCRLFCGFCSWYSWFSQVLSIYFYKDVLVLMENLLWCEVCVIFLCVVCYVFISVFVYGKSFLLVVVKWILFLCCVKRFMFSWFFSCLIWKFIVDCVR